MLYHKNVTPKQFIRLALTKALLSYRQCIKVLKSNTMSHDAVVYIDNIRRWSNKFKESFWKRAILERVILCYSFCRVQKMPY